VQLRGWTDVIGAPAAAATTEMPATAAPRATELEGSPTDAAHTRRPWLARDGTKVPAGNASRAALVQAAAAAAPTAAGHDGLWAWWIGCVER